VNKRYDSTKQWYAIHTYSGYEEKVAESIRQRAESLDMGDKIFQVLVPKEKMIEIKNGKRKVVEKRIFQGYVLVEMKLSEAAKSRSISLITALARWLISSTGHLRALTVPLMKSTPKRAN
jgi:transcription antitermination factor NusG